MNTELTLKIKALQSQILELVKESEKSRLPLFKDLIESVGIEYIDGYSYAKTDDIREYLTKKELELWVN
jgi:hypothetical protein